MKKIILACMAGLSTSILVSKMREAAADDSYECTITAHPISNIKQVGTDADIVLLGPQVRFQADSVRKSVHCPVEVVDMTAYGTMDGKKVMERVKEILGN